MTADRFVGSAVGSTTPEPRDSGSKVAPTCTRCGDPVYNRMPSESITQTVRMTRTTVTWRLRLSRFRWRWLPEDPADRVSESYTPLDLCDWCAGDVFLFAQGLPPRPPRSERPGASS